MSDSVVCCLTWVPRGAAKEVPDKVEVSADELKEIINRTRGNLNLDDDDILDEPEDDEDEEGWEDEDEEKIAAVASANKNKSKSKSKSKAATSRSEVDDIMKELDMDHYDDDEEQEPQESETFDAAGIAGVAYYATNEDDPYITLKDRQEDEEDEEIDDLTIRQTDNLILVGQTEDEYSRLDIYVYEAEEENAYVHHEILLAAFPLCMEWLDFDPSESEKGNLVAVGSMMPTIELWDLDVIDALQPMYSLAGQVPAEPKVDKNSSKKKKKKGKQARPDIAESTPAVLTSAGELGGHSDAVLGLSWNRPNRHLMASASADKTVRLWDLNSLECVRVFTPHKDKVQAVQWNPVEAAVLLTGSFDHTACVFDTRSPDAVARWKFQTDCESILWDPVNSQYFYLGTEDGSVMCCDARQTNQSLATISAHNKGVTGLSMSHLVPGCLVTASADKTVKVWDMQNHAKPAFVATKEFKAGPIYALSCSPDTPFRVAFGGGKGSLKVTDLMEIPAVAKHFHGRATIPLAPKRESRRQRREGLNKLGDNSEDDDMDEDMDDSDDEDAE